MGSACSGLVANTAFAARTRRAPTSERDVCRRGGSRQGAQRAELRNRSARRALPTAGRLRPRRWAAARRRTRTPSARPRAIELALEFDWQALRIPHIGTIGPGDSRSATPRHRRRDRAARQPTRIGLLHVGGGPRRSRSRPATYAVARACASMGSCATSARSAAPSRTRRRDSAWRCGARRTRGGRRSAPATAPSDEGTPFGTQFALGVQFALSVLDPHARSSSTSRPASTTRTSSAS